MIQEVIPGDQNATIGLHRDVWIWWSDGIGTTFENWADGHPRSCTESCAASVFNATHLGKWVENQCATTVSYFHLLCGTFLNMDTFSSIFLLNYICISSPDKKHLFHVKLTALKSTIDLNGPAVTVAILNLVTVIITPDVFLSP